MAFDDPFVVVGASFDACDAGDGCAHGWEQGTPTPAGGSKARRAEGNTAPTVNELGREGAGSVR